MKIEKLTETYINALAKVVDSYREFCGYPKSCEETKAFFKDLLTNGKSTTFIALGGDDEVMGFINLYPLYSTLALKKIWILNDLAVSDQFRRMGVAQALISESIKHARKTGAIRIELKTEQLNHNAQKLYSNLGFQIDSDHIYYRVPIK